MHTPHFLLAAGLASLATLAHADGKSQFDAFVKQTKSLSANFTQTLFDLNGKATDRSSGKLALRAPRQFRWQVLKPSEQLIVADGLNVFSYDVDLEQVNVRPQGEAEANSPLGVLLDMQLLTQQFKLAAGKDRVGMEVLNLTPIRKDTDFKMAELGFKNNQLMQMRLTDQLGQSTEINFSAWQRNRKLDPKLFKFVVPDGVDVVGEIKQAAEIEKLAD